MSLGFEISAIPSVRSANAPCARLASTLDELDKLADCCQELDARVRSPMQQLAWMRASVAAFAADAAPHVLAIVRGDRLTAVAPLVCRRVIGISRLIVAGARELFEPLDLAWFDEPSLDRLAIALARTGMPWSLERVPADSHTVARLKRRYRGRALVLTQMQSACRFIDLDERWLEPLQLVPRARQDALRHARATAEELGTVVAEVLVPELDDLPALLDQYFEVESRAARGRQNKRNAAGLQDVERAVFYRRYAEAATMAGMLRVCFLRIGNRVAAAQLAVEHNGAFWLLLAAQDQQYAACCPGDLLLRETIRHAVESGLLRFEFLGRSASIANSWTQAAHATLAIRVYPIGLRGLSALVGDTAMGAWRKCQSWLASALRPPKSRPSPIRTSPFARVDRAAEGGRREASNAAAASTFTG